MKVHAARRLVAALLAAVATTAAVATPKSAEELLLTGPEKGTYFAIAQDIARLVAAPIGLPLTAVPTRGSTENVMRMHVDRDHTMAMVQSDVYQAFLDEAAEGNATAAERVSGLRVMLALYSEELYFVVRADSPMQRLEDIRDQRINIGPQGSGTALSATTVYRQLFGAGVQTRHVSQFDNGEALRRLVGDRSVDVVAIVAGQPTPLFAAMTPDARRYIRLLRFEPGPSTPAALLATYSRSTILASSYPAWLDADVPALSTRALLVARDDRTPAAHKRLVRFSAALCAALPRLQAEGHAKWREVLPGMRSVGSDWRWHGAAQRQMARCNSDSSSSR